MELAEFSLNLLVQTWTSEARKKIVYIYFNSVQIWSVELAEMRYFNSFQIWSGGTSKKEVFQLSSDME